LQRRGNRGGPLAVLLAGAGLLLLGCPGKGDSTPTAPAPATSPSPIPAGGRVGFVDADGKPLGEGRLAMLSPDIFDGKGRLTEDRLAAVPERVRVAVEDAAPGAPATVAVALRGSDAPLLLPLSGPPARRLSAPFLLLGDREDAAASPSAILAAPGGRIEARYRGATAAELKVGPSVIHEIPVRFIAVGVGLPSSAELDQALDARLRQANEVWEPFGRRFVRGRGSRIDAFPGLVLIRGRAAGVDALGHPSRSGLRVDGKEISIPCIWRDDGAPLTPKAAARSLIEKGGAAFRVDLFGGLAGDLEAVLLRWRRRDGSSAAVERLEGSNDIAQAVAPLQVELRDGVEVAPSASLLSLEEFGVLASGRTAPAEGIDVFVVSGLRSLQARPAFKVYPGPQFPPSISGAAIASWSILDASGRYPYAFARLAGEMLLPPTLRPSPEDTLFADPLSEKPGIDARKRISAATGARIAERGRGLSGKK
jgi:hypothetical protein